VCEQRRIDPIEEMAQPAFAGDAVMVVQEPPQEVEIVLPQSAISSKSSQEAIVAQVTSSSTSLSGYITRQGSRLSSRSEKCCKSTASRARGASCSMIRVMIALHQRIRATTESQPERQHKISPKTPLT